MTQRKNIDIGPMKKPQPVLSDGLRKPTAVNLMKVNTVPLSDTNIAIFLQTPTRNSMTITDKVKGPEKTPAPKPLPLSGYKPIPHFSSGCRNC